MTDPPDHPPGPTTDSPEAARSPVEQAERMYAADVATRALGITITRVAAGRATATMTVRPDMVQGHGSCHGGYLFLLADTAFAFACNTHGPPTVAAGADVVFVAPAYAGDLLVAEAAERVRRGRSGVYDVTVRRADGTVVVEFRGRSRSLATKRPPGGSPEWPPAGAGPSSANRPGAAR